MRLTCPSCGAQYEVDDSVIPETGRDVQCSNCGHAWFQMPVGAGAGTAEPPVTGRPAAPEADAGPQADVEPQPEREPEPAPEPEPEPQAALQAAAPEAEPEPEAATFADEAYAEDHEAGPEPEAAPREAAAPDEPVIEHDTPEAAAAAAAFRRRTLDDAVRNVLREEAEREKRARQSEGAPLETQPDLAIPAAAARTAPAAAEAAAEEDDAVLRDRIARIRGNEDDLDEETLQGRASRKELLPDIEEINSTLTATSDRRDDAASRDAPETLQRRRSGFRLGLTAAALVLLAALVLYLFAPRLAERAPAMAPGLAAYTAQVDDMRDWLDARIADMTQALRAGD